MIRLPLLESAPAPSTEGDPPAGVHRLRKRDYVGYSAKLASRMLASRLFSRHRPLLVNIEPTHRCNLDCVYCDKVDARSPQMETQAALRMIDELAALGTVSVCFDGGEPLVHPGILALVQRAKTHGLRVSMSTNGMLLRRKPRVLDYVDVIKISIDGPAHVHDEGRGRGSFDKSIDGARFALEAGCKVAIRMTLAAHNVQYFRDVIQSAKELGIQALFQPAIGNIMNGADAPEAHSADVAGYRAAIDELMRLKRSGEPIGNERVCLEHLRHWPDPTPVNTCSGGRVEVAIGPEGNMYPCGRTGRNLPAPNVFELGVARAFEHVLRPTDCQNCWCTLTVAGCFLYGGDLRLLQRR
ncbi:MAG TPA: radical SAM protein [Polyangiaceae bacterium]|nr:radical SAM protein [Polyangiaceae bacterium]